MSPKKTHFIALSLLAFLAGCGSDSSTDGSGGAGGGSSDTNSGSGPNQAGVGPSGSTQTTSSNATSATGSGGAGGGKTGAPCSPTCTGTSLCNDALECVCAPGFTFDGTTCAVDPISDPTTRTKAEVCARLAAATQPVSPETIPGAGGCDPGTVPFAAEAAALQYLDFYRWMVGVGPVQVDSTMASAEQQCAEILNYSFGHDPTPDTMCYTMDGANACADSLIAGGFGLVGQVDGYALETAQNFIHHRNVLSVGRAGVWFGAAGSSSDMHYGGAYTALATDPRFVAHPGPGLQVMSKTPVSWWFVESGTETTPPVAAQVFVKSTMEAKPMIQQHYYSGFSSFQTDGWTPEADVTYVVNLVDANMGVYGSFETTFVNCP